MTHCNNDVGTDEVKLALEQRIKILEKNYKKLDEMNKDNLVRSLHLSPFKESLLKKARKGEYIDLVELREPNEEHEQIETSFKGANGEALIFSRKGSKNTQKVTSYIEWVKLSTALYNLYKEAGQHKLNESGLRHFFFCQTLDKYTWESIIAYDEAVRRAKPQGPWDQYLESVACRKLKLLDRNKINLKKRKGRNYEEEHRVILPCFFLQLTSTRKVAPEETAGSNITAQNARHPAITRCKIGKPRKRIKPLDSQTRGRIARTVSALNQ